MQCYMYTNLETVSATSIVLFCQFWQHSGLFIVEQFIAMWSFEIYKTTSYKVISIMCITSAKLYHVMCCISQTENRLEQPDVLTSTCVDCKHAVNLIAS